jgi:anti-anti-sigma regulatory factor
MVEPLDPVTGCPDEVSRGAAGSVSEHPTRVGVRLTGEFDLSNRDLLRQTAEALLAEADDVYVDASDLIFIDVRGIAELARLAQLRWPRAVVIENASTSLRRMLDVVWSDSVIAFDA